MDRKLLEMKLKTEGFRPRSYDLREMKKEESYCLSHEGNQWCVFYFERGRELSKKCFEQEDEACNELYRRLLADPGARENYVGPPFIEIRE